MPEAHKYHYDWKYLIRRLTLCNTGALKSNKIELEIDEHLIV